MRVITRSSPEGARVGLRSSGRQNRDYEEESEQDMMRFRTRSVPCRTSGVRAGGLDSVRVEAIGFRHREQSTLEPEFPQERDEICSAPESR